MITNAAGGCGVGSDWYERRLRPGRVTFWLYYGERVVCGVRADRGATRAEVIRLALEQHRRVPLVDLYETPFEREIRIKNAEVRL